MDDNDCVLSYEITYYKDIRGGKCSVIHMAEDKVFIDSFYAQYEDILRRNEYDLSEEYKSFRDSYYQSKIYEEIEDSKIEPVDFEGLLLLIPFILAIILSCVFSN